MVEAFVSIVDTDVAARLVNDNELEVLGGKVKDGAVDVQLHVIHELLCAVSESSQILSCFQIKNTEARYQDISLTSERQSIQDSRFGYFKLSSERWAMTILFLVNASANRSVSLYSLIVTHFLSVFACVSLNRAAALVFTSTIS